MRFSFRPLVNYASHLKKTCYDLAANIGRDGQLRRVIDGFLVIVTRKAKIANAVVIDLDGMLFAPMDNYGPNTPLWDVGRSIRSDENPTLIAMSQDLPVFSDLMRRRQLLPSKYVGEYGWPNGVNGSVATHTVCGGYLVSATIKYNSDDPNPSNPTPRSVAIERVSANGRTELGSSPFLTAALPTDDYVTLATEARLIELPISVFPIREDSKVVIAFATAEPGGTGYVAITDSPNNTYDCKLLIARYQVIDGNSLSPATATATLVHTFGQSSVLPEDRSETISAVDAYASLPSLPGASWSVTSLTDANPAIPLSENPIKLTRAAYQSLWMLRPVVPLDQDNISVIPAITAAPIDNGIVVLVTCRTWRDTALIPAIMHTDTPVPTDAPTEVGDQPAMREATYMITLTRDPDLGTISTSTDFVARTTVAVNDARWRDQRFEQMFPISYCMSNDRPAFLCHRVRMRSEGLLRDGAYTYACPGWRARADDTELVSILSDASIVEFQHSGLYPVRYNTIDGRTAGKFDFYDEGDDVSRYNYGKAHQNNLSLGGGIEFSRAYSACHYAPDMAIAVMAPTSGFMDDTQNAQLRVYRVSTGEEVVAGTVDMPFTVQNVYRGGEVIRWHVSCVQQGELEDDALTKYAFTIVAKGTRGDYGVIYRMQNLAQLWPIGVYEYPLLGGPVYYMGTPLALAKINVSTGRPLFVGDTV